MPPPSKRPKPEKHQWFDQWLVAAGEALTTLVNDTLRSFDQHEQATKPRDRARRAGDQRLHLERIEVIVCNLARAVLLPPPTGRLAVRLGHGAKGRSRYDNPALGGKLFSPTLYVLDDLGLTKVHRPRTQRGEVASTTPSAWFVGKVVERGITLVDFGRSATEEVVVLTRNTRAAFDPWGARTGQYAHRERIDYQETAETGHYRDEVRQINAALKSAELAFVDDGLGPVDVLDRAMRRHFVVHGGQDANRFDQGGRLFGGFWQQLPSSRRSSLRIDGEPVADLDYSAMFTRLAYARLGATPPPGDLYDMPELRGYRSGVKMAMNCLLFDKSNRRSMWPSEMGVGVGDDEEALVRGSEAAEFDARLPEDWTVKRTRAAILNKHPNLKPAWGIQLGYSLMFQESRILIAVLLELLSRNIVALPMHDGLLVAASKAEVAAEVMKATAQDITGIEMLVVPKLVSNGLFKGA